jgi:VanZ family protein
MFFKRIPLTIRLIMPILWYGLIYYITEQPGASSESTVQVVNETTAPVYKAISGKEVAHDLSNPLSDIINAYFRIGAHFFVFGIEGILLYFAFRKNLIFNKVIFLYSILIIAVLGISDEIHQSFIPNRHAATIDVLKDVLGATLFIWFICRFVKNKRKNN